MPQIRGRRVLIVEDDHLLARDLSDYFSSLGAIVLGPAGNVEAARDAAKYADAAVLDIDLNGQAVFPVADDLQRAGIPFVFYTGQDKIPIPARFQHAGFLRKPVSLSNVCKALFPEGESVEFAESNNIYEVLPKLRLAARLLMGDDQSADRLVERTLEHAVSNHLTKRPGESTEQWLRQLLEDRFNRSGRDLML